MQSILPLSAELCRHLVQWNAATECNVMLLLVCKVSSTPKACGAAVAVRLGRCPVRAQESKVRFADKPLGTSRRASRTPR